MIVFYYFFFFQAEDGIRDGHVTGVQTCALPILLFRLCSLLVGLEPTYVQRHRLLTGAQHMHGTAAVDLAEFEAGALTGDPGLQMCTGLAAAGGEGGAGAQQGAAGQLEGGKWYEVLRGGGGGRDE